MTAKWQVITGSLQKNGVIFGQDDEKCDKRVKAVIFILKCRVFQVIVPLNLPESLELEKSLSYRRSRSSFHSSCGPAGGE